MSVTRTALLIRVLPPLIAGCLAQVQTVAWAGDGPRRSKPCADEKSDLAVGQLVLRSCVTEERDDAYGTKATTSRVTLLFTPSGGTTTKAEVGEVKEHWEWQQQWKVMGILSGEGGTQRAAVLVQTFADVAFEGKRVEVRALSAGLPKLWASTDGLYEAEIKIDGARLLLKAKHANDQLNLGDVLERAPVVQTTLLYRDGRITSVAAEKTGSTSCAKFDALVAKTYGFRSAKLSPTERQEKTAGLDRFWKEVEGKRTELLPCLRSALRDPKRDPFFAFDGAALLRSLSDTPEDRQIHLDSYRIADLQDVALADWVQGLARLGYDGLDTSAAAARWLALKEPSYLLAAHATMIGMSAGALFLFGSMDERYATPALMALAAKATTASESRTTAIRLLMRQYTQESYQAVAQLKTETLPKELRDDIDGLRQGKGRLTPRKPAKIARDRFIKAFNALLQDNWDEFNAVNREVPDAELDLAAVLLPSDLPLLRKVRRFVIAHATPHMAALYDDLSRVIYTMTWRR